MHSADEDDNALAGRAHAGDISAFDELVRRHQQPISRILYRFFPSDAAGLEDVVQEVFVHAFRKLHLWRVERGSFGTWLRQLAYRQALDRLRRQRRNPLSRWLRREKLEAAEEDPLSSLPDPQLQRTSDFSASELLHTLISQLSPDEQTMINLFYFEDLSVADLAVTLGWSSAKAKTVAYRARKNLKSALQLHGYTSSREIF